MAENEILKILLELTGNASHAKKELTEVKEHLVTVKNVALEVQGALNAAFGAALLGGALALGFGGIIAKTIEWDSAVYHLSHVMNDNASDASKWMAIADYLGIPVEKLTMSMGFLSKAIDSNSKVFAEMNVHTRNADGTLRSLDQVLTDSIGYFQQHAGASDLAAKAKQLFGRAGMQMLPILTAEGSTIQDVADQAKKLGLVMDNNTLGAHMRAIFALKNLQQGFQALMIDIGNKFLPILAELGNALFQWIKVNIDKIANTIGAVLGFLAGFISGLLGISQQMDKTALEAGAAAEAVSNFGDNADTSAGAAENAARAQQELRDQTRAATDAINDQITAIERSDRQLDQAANDQIKAIEEQGNKEHAAQDEIKREQKLNQDKATVKKLQSDYANALLVGDLQLAQSIYAQMTAATQTVEDDELAIKTKASDDARKTQIDHIRDAMDARKRAHQEILDQLRDQLKAVQENAQKQAEAMTNAAKGFDAAFSQSFASMKRNGAATASELGTLFGSSLSSKANEAGKRFGDELNAILTGKKNFWIEIGSFIGQGIVTGIGIALRNGLGSYARNMPVGDFLRDINPFDISGSIRNILIHVARSIFGFAEGGIVPGIAGQPQLAVVHGGEVVLNQAQQRALLQGGAGGGHTFNITVYGATSQGANDTARAIKGTMLDFFGQR